MSDNSSDLNTSSTGLELTVSPKQNKRKKFFENIMKISEIMIGNPLEAIDKSVGPDDFIIIDILG